MDSVQLFNDELQSLLDVKPPVSKAKMGLITRAAMKGVKFYKHIVLSVEKFIAKCRAEYKVPGLYVIDSIVRQSRHQFGIERDVYAMRFSRNLPMTFESLFTGCLPEDKPKIIRVLNLWLKNGVFNAQTIQPLLNMAEQGSSSTDVNNLSATSPPFEGNQKLGHTSGYHFNSSGRHQKTNEVGLKFSKYMLDFDYGEEDDDNGDETPTEAEPPLSSTLNKIEMEQKNQKRSSSDLSYPSSQQQHHNPHYPDPVLERWNRIIRGESSNELSDNGTARSRSRSPPSHTLFIKQNMHDSSTTRDFIYKPPLQIKSETIAPPIERDTAKEAERAAERERKCLPKIRDKHLTVCSSTLWLGHVPKTVSEADLSNAFGVYGTITSIDLIPPRGCAYVCMDRRQDAKRALNESKDLKLNGSHIKMAWAPGKGFNEYKKLKDFWEVESGSSFIPYSKIDNTIDFDVLEEGGVIDEDSMSIEMLERRDRKHKERQQQKTQQDASPMTLNTTVPMPALPLMNQPPPPTSIAPFNIPPPNMTIPPPSALSLGMIHFPPPPVPITTSTAAIPIIAPSPLIKTDESTSNTNVGGVGVDQDDESPSNIDQQLSMTDRQISMVQQQLDMIKQAQNMANVPNNVSQGSSMPVIQQPAQSQPIFHHHHHHQNQPNPMMFDANLQPAPLITGGQPMLDPSIFMNPHAQLLGQPSLMLPLSQASMMDPNSMIPHQPGRF